MASTNPILIARSAGAYPTLKSGPCSDLSHKSQTARDLCSIPRTVTIRKYGDYGYSMQHMKGATAADGLLLNVKWGYLPGQQEAETKRREEERAREGYDKMSEEDERKTIMVRKVLKKHGMLKVEAGSAEQSIAVNGPKKATRVLEKDGTFKSSTPSTQQPVHTPASSAPAIAVENTTTPCNTQPSVEIPVRIDSVVATPQTQIDVTTSTLMTCCGQHNGQHKAWCTEGGNEPEVCTDCGQEGGKHKKSCTMRAPSTTKSAPTPAQPRTPHPRPATVNNGGGALTRNTPAPQPQTLDSHPATAKSYATPTSTTSLPQQQPVDLPKGRVHDYGDGYILREAVPTHVEPAPTPAPVQRAVTKSTSAAVINNSGDVCGDCDVGEGFRHQKWCSAAKQQARR